MKTCHLIWPLLWHENQLISSSTQFQYLKTTRKSDLIQNKLKPASLGTDWIENKRFRHVFAKTSVFMPKPGSINSGTGLLKWLTNTGSEHVTHRAPASRNRRMMALSSVYIESNLAGSCCRWCGALCLVPRALIKIRWNLFLGFTMQCNELLRRGFLTPPPLSRVSLQAFAQKETAKYRH